MTIVLISGLAKGQADAGLGAPVAQSFQKHLQYKQQVAVSQTAQTIETFLDESSLWIGLLITLDYDSMYIPPSMMATQAATSSFTGGLAVLNPESTLQIKGQIAPLGVSLYHELGHAKQYLEKPQWFENMYKQAMSGGTNRNSNPAKYEIEDDNLNRHETPILRELGKNYFRDKYD